MQKQMEKLTIEPTASTSDARNADPRRINRQGKGSRAKNNDKFRKRKNQEFDTKNRRQISTRLGWLDSDESRRLKELVYTIKLTQKPQAIPLSVTTRSVGFTVALFYDRSVTTWNLQQIEAIATIHQFYRVAIWAAHFKVWHAQSIQTEPISSGDALRFTTIVDDRRQILSLIGVVPSVFAIVINSIGKIETQTGLYHSGYAHAPTKDDQDILEYAAMVVNPDNIRDTLVTLSDAFISTRYSTSGCFTTGTRTI